MKLPSFFVVKKNQVVLTSNLESYIGAPFALVCAILMDTQIDECYMVGTDLYDCVTDIDAKAKAANAVEWNIRYSSRGRRTIHGDAVGVFDLFADYIKVESKQSRYRLKSKKIVILNLELLCEKPPLSSSQQMAMGKAIVDIQKKRGVRRIGYTRGAIGSKLLTASPLWRKGRRAAPRLSNDVARKLLPGNYYALSKKAKDAKKSLTPIPSGYYIDQNAAYHTIATQIGLPSPDTIRLRGLAYADDMERRRSWANRGGPLFNSIVSGRYIGVFLARVSTGIIPPTERHLYPRWALKKEKYVWIWSPEFRLFENDQRLQLDSIYSAVATSIRDPVPNEYGTWALDYIENNPRDKQYTKTILLAAYGMLGFNSTAYKQIFRYYTSPTPRSNRIVLPTAGVVYEQGLKLDKQHNVTNVLAKGLIEAEVLTRSLEYAKELHRQGFHVAQIYSDGIIVETDQLPFLKEGWRVSDSLTNIIFPNPNMFIANERKALPGIPRDEQEAIWLKYREESLRPVISLVGST